LPSAPGLKSERPKAHRPFNLIIRLLARSIKGDRAMTCHNCRIECSKDGKRPDGMQRYRCNQCGKKFSDRKDFGMFHKQLDQDAALLALQLLVEGNSIRSTQRITGLDKKTIMKLLVETGERLRDAIGSPHSERSRR